MNSVPPQTVSKYNSQYHKLFQTVPKEEILMKGTDSTAAPSTTCPDLVQTPLTQLWTLWLLSKSTSLSSTLTSCWARLSSSSSLVYSCALLRDILLQGRLYISRNWLCFYANLFGKDIKVSGRAIFLPVDLHPHQQCDGLPPTRDFFPHALFRPLLRSLCVSVWFRQTRLLFCIMIG